MLSCQKIKDVRQATGISIEKLASSIVRSGLDEQKARAALINWERGLMKPKPTTADIDVLARSLGVDQRELVVWSACHRYAPIAPRKVRLVTNLIQGRFAQEALDLLEFANKRAAVMVKKVLKSAIANADEQEADVERLFVSEARVDEGGIRLNTRRWRPKDRGRAVPFIKLASHIRISVDME